MGRSLGTGTAFSASEDYAVESLSVALSLRSDSFPAAYSVSIRSGARPLSARPAKRETNQHTLKCPWQGKFCLSNVQTRLSSGLPTAAEGAE